jgi:membrane protease YdiL (CAAX protease family)
MMQILKNTSDRLTGVEFLFRFFSLLMLMIIGNLLFLGISGVFANLIWDYNFFTHPQMLSNTSDEKMIEIIRFFQGMQSVGMFLVPGLVWIRIFRGSIRQNLFSRNTIRNEVVIALFLVIVVAMPMINGLAALNEALQLPEAWAHIENSFRSAESRAYEFMIAILSTDSISVLLVNIFVVAVLPAVSEEVLFRGVLQNDLERKFGNPIIAVIITALIFSAFHYQFFTFLPRFVLGVMLGLTYVWSRNLLVPVVLHFFNNGLSVLAWYYFKPETINNDLDTIGTFGNMWPLAIVSSMAVLGIFYWLHHFFMTQPRS